MAEQQKKLMISRAAMKSIRAMNREQLSEYITNVYVEGFKAGRKKSTPDDILKAFREVLISVDSIGPARADAIMKRFSDFSEWMPPELLRKPKARSRTRTKIRRKERETMEKKPAAQTEYEAAVKALMKFVEDSTDLNAEILTDTYPIRVQFIPKRQLTLFGDPNENVDQETGELNDLTVTVGLTTSVKSTLKFKMDAKLLKKLIKLSETVGTIYYNAFREEAGDLREKKPGASELDRALLRNIRGILEKNPDPDQAERVGVLGVIKQLIAGWSDIDDERQIRARLRELVNAGEEAEG